MAKKAIQIVALGLISGALALGIAKTGALQGVEALLWRWRVNLLASESTATANIKVILLDQASLDWGAAQRGWSWPWPRQVYEPILAFCRRAGVRSISFDVLFTEPSAYGVEDDELLGKAFDGQPAALAVFVGRQAEQQQTWPDFAARPDWLKGKIPEATRVAITEPGAAFPVPEIAAHVAWPANVKDSPDRDGVFRRATLARIFDNTLLPSLGLAAYLAAHPTPCTWSEGWFHIGERRLPVDRKGRMILNFRGKTGTHQGIRAAAVINSELSLREGKKPELDPGVFKDCHVLFGFSAPGLKDLRPTPVGGDYPGVEIHATLLDNLLAADPLRDTPGPFNTAAVPGLALLCALAILKGRNARWNVITFFAATLLVGGLGLLAYKLGWWWPMAPPAVACALALVGGVVWNYATEGRQKRFIKSAFNQYVGPDVLDELVAHPEKLALGGEKRELTMFFSDLEKFSSFSERLDPPRLIELLNIYLTEMGAILKEEGAYLDKFVGDAIVAFWNAPVRQTDPAVRAVRATLRCRRRCEALQAEWEARFGAIVRMRVGMNTGEVVVGNMGSRDKFNYTMLGDAANVAARLEGANKAFGTYTMIAEPTWQQAAGSVTGREIGAITVVGRHTPLRVFEPLALAGEALPDWVAGYEAGLAACREKHWAAALALFEAIKDDPVARVYATRCRALVDGTLADWDGIWNLTEK